MPERAGNRVSPLWGCSYGCVPEVRKSTQARVHVETWPGMVAEKVRQGSRLVTVLGDRVDQVKSKIEGSTHLK